jgi:hypothetical protein
MKEWANSQGTQEFLQILLWNKQNSIKEFFNTNNDDINKLLVGKGYIQGLDSILNILNGIANYKENDEEETEG